MVTKNTNALQKLSVSIINVFIVSILSIPAYLAYGYGLNYKILLVVIFLFYNLIFIFATKNRCLGMIILNIYWKEEYSHKNQIIYAFLYTLSFSTIVIWVFFPFDLLLINLLLIQLPFVLKTGTTAHGYFSGKMSGYTKIR